MLRTAIGLLALILLFPLGAGARTWHVSADGTGEVPSIQAAIDLCSSGDTVLVAAGTYAGAGNRDIDFLGKAIVVMSASGAAVTIVDCGGSEAEPHRGFYFHTGEDTTSVLRGFTVTNGSMADRGGAIRCVGSSPKIVENTIANSWSNGGGGGISCEGTHSILRGNTFTNNRTTICFALSAKGSLSTPLKESQPVPLLEAPSGGNILCVRDSSRIELNAITEGVSTYGSAIFCDGSEVRLWNNDIFQNGAHYTTGSVYFASGSYDIGANQIRENYTSENGGGLYCSGGTYRITGNTISGNRGFGESSGLGGGMYCGPGSYTIADNEIMWNWTPGAGGIYFCGGSGSILRNYIHDNETSFAGPCAAGFVGSPAFGSSLDMGGGIAIYQASSLVVSQNVITHNSAPMGGGISCVDASPEITDNVIALNVASRNPCGLRDAREGVGAGIYCESASPVIARNTIYGNSAVDSGFETSYAAGGGVYCTLTSSPSISRNIVALNRVDNLTHAAGIYCDGSTCTPEISCNDVYGNANGNYGGSLTDPTGLSGNISEDPLFCDAANGEFHIYRLSPCAPGHHPGGADCGLIGALGPACDILATLLASYSTDVRPAGVTITWTLSQAGEGLHSRVFRAEGRNGAYETLAGAAITNDGLAFVCVDASIEPGAVYRYRVDVADEVGARTLFETGEIATPAVPLSMEQNVPNPFNPSTAIAYYLPRDSKVSLTVYDVSGRLVVSLVDGPQTKGRHSIAWNGRDSRGGAAGSGIYFYRLTAGKETISKKMVMLR